MNVQMADRLGKDQTIDMSDETSLVRLPQHNPKFWKQLRFTGEMRSCDEEQGRASPALVHGGGNFGRRFQIPLANTLRHTHTRTHRCLKSD